MRKRLLSLLLSASMAVMMLAGCGAGKTATDSGSAATEGSIEEAVASVAAETPTGDPVKIGLLFSSTGSTSISEGVMLAATTLAIDEINAAGGVAGHPIEYIHEDIQSDSAVSAEKAKKLILEDECQILFGAMSSQYRQAVLPVVEEYDAFLFYSTIYEGQEQSPNIVYSASIPNQIVPVVGSYMVEDMKRSKVFVIGTDYVYAHLLNEAFITYLEENGVEIVGEEYTAFGQTDFSSLMTKIKASGADCILSQVIGDSVVAMHKEYSNQGFKSSEVPIVSSALGSNFIAAMGAENAAGNYYFCGVNTLKDEVIEEFTDKIYAKYGDMYAPDSSTYGYYVAVYLWAGAMEKAYAADDLSLDGLREQFFNASYGDVIMDPETNHAYAYAKIQYVEEDGSLTTVKQSESAEKPDPFAY
ncbi:MAG: transporter substrate-binding protein [Lachnospiraceae bacterium]|nr:transporter substrate-binding protein [Lachnospiraceae bacterium]